MYFPLLICEVKGSDRPVQEAEHQAVHSASIAIRAVINSTVKIFGHFATIEGGKTTLFYRHRLHSTDFDADLASKEWARAYKITRAIYEDFFPQHLARIRSALSKLRGPSLASFTSQLGLDEDSQESTPSRSSSRQKPTESPYGCTLSTPSVDKSTVKRKSA